MVQSTKDAIKKKIYDTGVAVLTPMMGTLKETKFLEKGVLTPEEFVIAGDNLVHKCATWQWASGDQKSLDNRFPADKQYLITRQVSCMKRIKEIEAQTAKQAEVELEDGWIETNHADQADKNKEDNDAVDLDAEVINAPNEKDQEAVDLDDDDDCVDLDAEMEDQTNKNPDSDNIFGNFIKREGDDLIDDNEVVTGGRKYDLSISYDFFHQTPRLWLLGYKENGQILTQAEMFEDIMADYANKTVTYEDHPKLQQKWMSIHPCNHAKVMKKIIDTIQSNGGTPRVEFCLFVFLKFISSVVPTIEYDFTIDLELD